MWAIFIQFNIGSTHIYYTVRVHKRYKSTHKIKGLEGKTVQKLYRSVVNFIPEHNNSLSILIIYSYIWMYIVVESKVWSAKSDIKRYLALYIIIDLVCYGLIMFILLLYIVKAWNRLHSHGFSILLYVYVRVYCWYYTV